MLRAVKGMNDSFEEDLVYWRELEKAATGIFLRHGYGEIRTPVVEVLELFSRSVGESSDIVSKEMYSLVDRDGSLLCLRPENTAGVVRAMIENGKLQPDSESKVFYFGPMFRRERPQKGRLRQFHQLGAEVFGTPDASVDVELITMIWDLLKELGISELKLDINTLGDAEDRVKYSRALRAYFGGHEDKLCVDCVRRLQLNPLRILDCKNPGCQLLVGEAPAPVDFLSEEAALHFQHVQEGLSQLKIPFTVSPRLVRGLDYYTRTVFEISTSQGLGAQNALAGGGRYDALVEELGGKSTSAIGFSAGMERIVLAMQSGNPDNKSAGPDIVLVYADDIGKNFLQSFAHDLRSCGLSVCFSHQQRSVKSQMRTADKLDTVSVIVIGTEEVKQNSAKIKMMKKDASATIALNAPVEIGETLRRLG